MALFIPLLFRVEKLTLIVAAAGEAVVVELVGVGGGAFIGFSASTKYWKSNGPIQLSTQHSAAAVVASLSQIKIKIKIK